MIPIDLYNYDTFRKQYGKTEQKLREQVVNGEHGMLLLRKVFGDLRP